MKNAQIQVPKSHILGFLDDDTLSQKQMAEMLNVTQATISIPAVFTRLGSI